MSDDIASLSDEQLKALYSQPSSSAPDLGKISDDELKALHSSLPPTDAAGIAQDIAKSGGIGLANGAIGIAGLPGDAANLLTKGSKIASDYIADKLGIDKGPEPTGPLLPTSGSIQKGVEGVTGDFYKPKTTAGEYAQTIGEFAPAMVGGEASAIPRFIDRVAAPAIASETAGQLTKGSEYEPYARIAAGAAGGLRGGSASTATKPLTAEDAIKAGGAAYESPVVKNVLIDSSKVGDISSKMMDELNQSRFNDRIAPQTRAVVSDLATPVSGKMLHTMEDYQTTRELLGKIAGNYGNPLEQAAASKAIKSLDQHFSNIAPSDVVSGDIGAANATIGEGRANYAAGKAAQRIQEKIDNAELQAASAHSGGNVDNATRQKLRTVLTDPKQGRGLSPDELDQIDQVVRGSPAGNALRAVGSMLGGKGGLATLLAASEGYHALGPIGAAAPAAGYGVKKLGDVLTQRAANKAVQQILSRAPTAPVPSVATRAASTPGALARAIVAGQAAAIPQRLSITGASVPATQSNQ